MAKPSKRRWAVEKRTRRVLAQREKAQRVAARLLGNRSSFMPGTKEWEDLNWQRLCKDHNK